MMYEKPEVVKLANAVDAIHSELDKTSIQSDSEDGSAFVTNTAYQADE